MADVRNVIRARPTWRRVMSFLAPMRGQLVALLACCFVGVGATLAQPFLFSEAIDAVVSRAVPGVPDSATSLTTIALLVLASGVVIVATTYAELTLRGSLGERVTAVARDQVLDHLQHQPYGFFIHANPGAVLERLTWEAVRSGQATGYVIAEGARAALMLVAGIALVAVHDPRMAVVLPFLALFLIPSRWIRRQIRSAVVEQALVQTRYTGLIQERLSVSGALLTRVFGMYDANREQIGARAEKSRELSVTSQRWQALNQSLIVAGLSIAVVGVVWLGGNAVINGSMTIGDLALLLFFVRILTQPIQTYGQLRFELMRGFLAYTRLFEVFDLARDDRPSATAAAPPVVDDAGSVEFRRVRFRYPTPKSLVPAGLGHEHLSGSTDLGDQEFVLDDVSFRVEPGSFVALAGPSGSGKSTVAALAAGLYAPTEGEVLLGGVGVRTLDEETRRRSVGLVTQDTHLIHDTIRANLLLARPDAADKQIVKACAAAGIHKFIRSLPNGYGTVVGERGVRLSGGQRQRLAFARVLLLDPPVVILDEATAHLDAESEALLREAVERVLADRTRLVIAHRLSTIIDANEIIILEKGRVVERGSHHDLIAAGGRYCALYRTQFLRDESPTMEPLAALADKE